MHRKKLAIIGRGTVGCTAAIYFLSKTDWLIDWYYDPNIEPASVGEGTNLILPRTLDQLMNFNSKDLDNINATPKLGIWKRNWGNGCDYKHTFPAHMHGIHFNAVEFQKYIFDKIKHDKRITLIERNVTDYENLDADYVMVCTGSPKGMTEKFNIRDKIPVNTATVFQCPWDLVKFNYSLTFAKKHGWVFGIPIQNRCSIGYLYNDQFSTKEQVTKDVQDILKEFDLEPAMSRTLKFSNYSRKQNFSERIIYNGNASFFLEPLEATSTGFAENILQASYEFWTGKLSLNDAEMIYQYFLNDIECMICLHYFAGSRFKSDFWQYAEDLGTQKMLENIQQGGEFSKMIRSVIEYDCSSSYTFPFTNIVGTWNFNSYWQNIEGLGVKEKFRKLLG